MSDVGVDITKLDPNTELVVETPDCLYDITVVDPQEAEITITGGSIFKLVTPAIVEASCHKEDNKPKWIGKNMSIVIRYKIGKQRKFRTTETGAVESIIIISPKGDWQYEVK